uniref:Uncharacterized protein n=1 Tax=Sipha flava TaxID=143950 RepID=A0A2S2PX43_9HEMI
MHRYYIVSTCAERTTIYHDAHVNYTVHDLCSGINASVATRKHVEDGGEQQIPRSSSSAGDIFPPPLFTTTNDTAEPMHRHVPSLNPYGRRTMCHCHHRHTDTVPRGRQTVPHVHRTNDG